MTLGLTQLLTEMWTRNLAHKIDSLTAIYELIVWRMWEPQCLSPLGLHGHLKKEPILSFKFLFTYNLIQC
jgi:hypothetical protein